MKRHAVEFGRWFRLVAACLVLALAALGAAPTVRPVTSHAKNKSIGKLETVTLAIRHRVFHQFSDVRQVKLNQDFEVGDTEYSGRVVRYVPDFAMDLKTGKVVTRSEEPRNPAFQIIVREKGVPQDTTWALLRMPPHFAQKSMLAFKIARIDFVGREPILADTTHADEAPASGGMALDHGGMPMPPGMPHGMSGARPPGMPPGHPMVMPPHAAKPDSVAKAAPQAGEKK